MHAAGVGSLRPVHGEEGADLGQNPVERTGLEAAGGDRVAVHGIAGPDHLAALPLYSPD